MVHCRVECDAQFARQGILSEGSLALELEQQRLSIAELISAAVRAQMATRLFDWLRIIAGTFRAWWPQV